MKKFIILSILLLFVNSAMAQIVTNSGLERIEKQVFNQTFTDDTYEKRIERLETKLFGAQQSGNTDDRFITLKNAARNYKTFAPRNNRTYTYYPNKSYCSQYQPPLFTYGQGSDWRRTMWNNFRNYSGMGVGVPTGITPAMDPAYMDWFEADRAARNQYYQSNQGYMYKNTNSSTQTGVSIMD